MPPITVPSRPWLTKTRLYHVVGRGPRIYVARLLLVGCSVLWVAKIAGYLDERTLAVTWLTVAGMGSAFLVLLVPLYYASRLQSRAPAGRGDGEPPCNLESGERLGRQRRRSARG